MKRIVFFAAMLALGVGTLLVSTDTQASCANAVSFDQGSRPGAYACGGGARYCYVVSPGQDQITTLQADFWSLQTGDPAVGPGDDDGARANGDWLTRYSPAYGIYMIIGNNWSQPAIDGCIEGKIPTGFSGEVMVAAFSDRAGDDSTSYWAVAATLRTPGSSPQFDFRNSPASDITLVEVPTPNITASRTIDPANIGVTVQCPDLSAGFYSDGNVALGDVVQGCQVYRQQLGVGAPGPGPRDVGQGWAAVGAVIAPGTSAEVTLGGCDADSSNYLAIGIALDSGFGTNFLSPNSTRVDCGPNVADPQPRFKLIDKKDRPSLRPKER